MLFFHKTYYCIFYSKILVWLHLQHFKFYGEKKASAIDFILKLHYIHSTVHVT